VVPWTNKARKAPSDVAQQQTTKYNLETVRATLEACTHDLSEENGSEYTLGRSGNMMCAKVGIYWK
jgi:hypothetical protein